MLRAGQGLVLVDEVPAGRRRLVREWLRELVTAFPAARVVVTSRPAAADQRWLHDEGFGSVLLEQMSPADVRVFLQRRHEAARDAESLPCAPQDLPVAERRLLRQLDNRPHLRALAASPLLCALNLGRTSELPQSRMELYQAALTMLLDLRDAELQIAGMLGGTEKTVLPRDLAETLAGLSETAAAATTRAVALTGGADAIPRLARYAQDPSPAVQREVAQAWEYFDPERYAHEVLADAPLHHGNIDVTAHRLLPHLKHLRKLTDTNLRLRGNTDPSLLRGVPHLRRLFISDIAEEVDPAPPVEHHRLRRLFLPSTCGRCGGWNSASASCPRMSTSGWTRSDPG